MKKLALSSRAMPATLFLAAALASSCAGEAPEDIDDLDGPDCAFIDPGKADAAGIADGSPEARGVLALANQATFEILSAKGEVGLGDRAASNIVAARSGPDGVDGNADDRPFSTLAQLDAVPYVGPKAFEKLLLYAKANGFVNTGTPLAAQASRVPWSGYWWSMLNAELALGWDDGLGRRVFSEEDARAFDACIDSYTSECADRIADMAGEGGRGLSPLMKFDYYVRLRLEADYGPDGAAKSAYAHATRWELDHHYIGTNTSHRYWDARGYSGKCIGWALATMDFDEPTREAEVGGVLFRPADVKGILASIYNGAQFFVPESLSMGNAFHNVPGADTPEHYEDVHPHDFVRALSLTIAQGKMLEGDLDPGDGVWNYPIHRYELSFTRPQDDRADVRATIWYANDEVGIDEVFSTNPERPDILSRELTFELDLPAGFDGDLAKATGGRWTGSSVGSHPDALILGLEEGWRSTIYDYSGTMMKNEVNYPLIKRHKTDAGWEPIVDELLDAYYATP